MRTLNRYVAKQLVAPFATALLMFTGLFFTHRLFDVLEKILGKGVTGWDGFRLMAYLVPNLCVMTVPMATLTAALMTYGRMSSDNEIIATKSAGLSLARMAVPAVAAGALITGIMLTSAQTLIPAANRGYQRLAFECFSKHASVALKERVFVDAFDQYEFFVGRIDPATDELADVRVHIPRAKMAPAQDIRANSGSLRKDPKSLTIQMELRDGVLEWPRLTDPSWFQQIRFSRYLINLDIRKALARSRAASPEHSELSASQLLAQARDPAQSDQTHRRVGMEFHRRIALPFANLAVLFAAIPLGVWFRKGGLVGGAVAVGVILVYYVFFALGETWGLGGTLPPWAGCWLPNVVLSLGGGLLFYATQHEIDLHSLLPLLFRVRRAA